MLEEQEHYKGPRHSEILLYVQSHGPTSENLLPMLCLFAIKQRSSLLILKMRTKREDIAKM